MRITHWRQIGRLNWWQVAMRKLCDLRMTSATLLKTSCAMPAASMGFPKDASQISDNLLACHEGYQLGTKAQVAQVCERGWLRIFFEKKRKAMQALNMNMTDFVKGHVTYIVMTDERNLPAFYYDSLLSASTTVDINRGFLHNIENCKDFEMLEFVPKETMCIHKTTNRNKSQQTCSICGRRLRHQVASSWAAHFACIMCVPQRCGCAQLRTCWTWSARMGWGGAWRYQQITIVMRHGQ